MVRRATTRKDLEMVFLKFKREDDTWQWRFDLTEVTAVGKGTLNTLMSVPITLRWANTSTTVMAALTSL